MQPGQQFLLKADKYKISRCHLKVTGLLCMAALCISAPDWEETSLWLNTEWPSWSTGEEVGAKKEKAHLRFVFRQPRFPFEPLREAKASLQGCRCRHAVVTDAEAGSHRPPSSLPGGPWTATAVSGGRPAFWETALVQDTRCPFRPFRLFRAPALVMFLFA